MQDLYVLARELWLVWFMLLFIGIVAWAFWPTRRRKLQEHADIPLRDDRSPAGKKR